MSTPSTMTEKDMFLATWNREHATTLKLLRNLPAGKEDYRPAPKSRTARELAWIFLVEEQVAIQTAGGNLQLASPPPAPSLPITELIGMYEASHRESQAKIAAMSEPAWNAMVKFPVGPGTLGDLRAADVMWTMVMDAVHHRGQLSVYLRILDAKVPSIYGPSADEPWPM